jgi:hypothetical protein
MIPALDPATGWLPLGRFPAAITEIKSAFVDHPDFAGSNTRSTVFQHWSTVINLLNSVVPIACMWVGGSMLTNKLDPEDVDCIFWVEDADLIAAGADPVSNAILGKVNTAALKARGVRVDAYVMAWNCNLRSPQIATAAAQEYYKWRGYWDDLWARKYSQSTKGRPSVRLDTIPRRGYLEVMVDGWKL